MKAAAPVHRQAVLRCPFLGERVEVDAGLAPLLTAIWRHEWLTYTSCEDTAGYVAVEFEPMCAELFLAAILRHGSPLLRRVAREELFTLAGHRWPEDMPEERAAMPERWMARLNLCVLGKPGKPSVSTTISFFFPRAQLAAVVAAVEAEP